MAEGNYVVVSRNGTTSLAKAVQKLIDEGWTPIGGVSISKSTKGRNTSTLYHQAMSNLKD